MGTRAPVLRRVGELGYAHLETCRPYTLGYVGLVSLAGAGLAAPDAQTWRLVGAWAVPTLAWLAGLYGGDYFDRELDAIAKPHRPIPSGRMPAWMGLAGLVGFAGSGAVIGGLLNWRTAAVAATALVAGIAYSTFFKARGLAGNVVRGAITALAFVFGTMATAPLPTVALLLPALIFWAHDAGSNLVGTVRDVDGDRAGGYTTLAVRKGVQGAIGAAGICWLLWSLLALATVVWLSPAGVSPWPAAILLAVASLAGLAALATLITATEPVPPATALRAHAILVVERLALACGLVALGLGATVALAVLIPTLAVTLVSQRAMRSRYEFGADAAIPVTAGTTGAAVPDATEVLAYVDAQLHRLAERDRPLQAVRGWQRKIRIEITDLPLTVRILADGEALSRMDTAAVTDTDDLVITTTAGTFRDLFLTGRSNPRRAYLTGNVRMSASARDMMRLNQIFTEFRRSLGESRRPVIPAARTAPREEMFETDAPAERDSLAPVVVISDTTLRDGEQMPGVAFTPLEKVDLARRLDAIGVPLIEAGFPAVSEPEAQAVRRIVDAGLSAMIQVIARPRPADIDAAAGTGAHSIALFIGTSDSHITAKLRTTRTRLVEQVAQAVAYAKSTDRQVVFAAEDATRTDIGFLIEVFHTAIESGADALGIADTAGVATPERFARMVARVTDACSQPVAVHCHNDLGLATANSLAGLRAGASGVQCSVLGVGERAGNAALEEVVMGLEIGYGHRTGVELAALTGLAQHVAELVGHPLAATRPVVGGHAFVHESGLHVDGVLSDASTYEPYSPELVGQQRRLVFGKHSGQTGVGQVLRSNALTLEPTEVSALLTAIKQRGEAKQALDESAVVALARAIRNSGRSR